MNKPKFTVEESLRYAWNVTLNNIVPLIIITIIALLVFSIPDQLQGALIKEILKPFSSFADDTSLIGALISGLTEGAHSVTINPLYIITGLIGLMLAPLATMSFIRVALLIIDKQKVNVESVERSWPLYWKYFSSAILYTFIDISYRVLLLAGIFGILEITLGSLTNPSTGTNPGGVTVGSAGVTMIYAVLLTCLYLTFLIRFSFYGFFVIDQQMGPIAAFHASSLIVEKAFWQVVLFGLVLTVINIIGFLCLGVGLLVTIPTSVIASGYVYRKLTGDTMAMSHSQS